MTIKISRFRMDMGAIPLRNVGTAGLIAAPSADQTASGFITQFTAGEGFSFGEVGYIASTGKILKGDADAIATAGAVVMALATIATDASGDFLLHGFVRNDAWSWTPGNILYLSTTSGAVTATQPSGTDDVIQILGIATHADRMYFHPQLVQIEHT